MSLKCSSLVTLFLGHLKCPGLKTWKARCGMDGRSAGCCHASRSVSNSPSITISRRPRPAGWHGTAASHLALQWPNHCFFCLCKLCISIISPCMPEFARGPINSCDSCINSCKFDDYWGWGVCGSGSLPGNFLPTSQQVSPAPRWGQFHDLLCWGHTWWLAAPRSAGELKMEPKNSFCPIVPDSMAGY